MTRAQPSQSQRSPLLDGAVRGEAATHWTVYALFVVFGMGSWLAVNGAFVELPLYARTLPEGWAISTYLGVVLQLANFVPLLLLLWRRRWLARRTTLAVCTLVTVGVAASLALAWCWDRTAVVLGRQRSVWLMALVLVAGCVDCSTSVVYWPFAMEFKRSHVVALAVGEGMSGLVTGVLGLAQNPAGHMRFSVRTFFIVIAVLMAASGAAYLVLAFWRGVEGERRFASVADAISRSSSPLLRPLGGGSGGSGSSGGGSDAPVTAAQAAAAGVGGCTATLPPLASRQRALEAMERLLPPRYHAHVWRCVRTPAMHLAALSFVQNGVLVSIITYALLPFPHGNSLLLAAGVAAMTLDPLASFAVGWLPRAPSLPRLAAAWLPLTVAVLALAAASPHPPGERSLLAGIAAACVYVLLRALLALAKATAFTMVQARASADPTLHALLAASPRVSALRAMEALGGAVPSAGVAIDSVPPAPPQEPVADAACLLADDVAMALLRDAVCAAAGRVAGGAVQAGSFCGSALMFLLVVVLRVFHGEHTH